MKLEFSRVQSYVSHHGVTIPIRGHLVSLEMLDVQFDSVVYFIADGHIAKTLLGRTGWLDRVRIGLVHHDSLLYLAAYDFDK